MKILAVLITSLTLIGSAWADEHIKEKTVCKDKKDKSGNVVKNKDGKPEQVCKTIKVHKKLEGTKVPEKK